MITFGCALDYLSKAHKPCAHTDACVAVVVDRAKKLHKALWAVRVLREAAHIRVLTGNPNDWFTNTDEELMHLAKVIFTEELPAEARDELGECP